MTLLIKVICFILLLVAGCSYNKSTPSTSTVQSEKSNQVVHDLDIAGVPIIYSQATVKVYEDLASMEQDSDLIVVGKPQDSFSEIEQIKIEEAEHKDKLQTPGKSVQVFDNLGLLDYKTNRRVKVLKIIGGNEYEANNKGKNKLKEIIVSEDASYIDRSEELVIEALPGFTPLEKNNKYILFLRRTNPEFKTQEPTYSIASVFAGKHNLSKDDKKEQAILDKAKEQFLKAKEKYPNIEIKGFYTIRENVERKYLKDYQSATDI